MKEFLFFMPLLFGAGGAGIVAKIGTRLGLSDIPSSRSSHTISTPKGGGVGILFSFLLVCLYLKISFLFWFPSIVVALISFWGDKYDLSPKLRLICQFILAGIILGNMDLEKFAPIFNTIHTSITYKAIYISIFICLLVFVVGTANFYNFMDGINGIAGITGFIAFSLIGIVAFINRSQSSYFILAVSIALSCLGFLPFNFPKAKVFMGDVGSILLGFVFASLVILISKNWTDFFCYSGFIFPFFTDEIITMLERIKRKESLTKPHRCHFYQILVNEKKIDHWKVALGYGIVQLSIGLVLLVAKNHGLVSVIAVLTLAFILFSYINYLIKKTI